MIQGPGGHDILRFLLGGGFPRFVPSNSRYFSRSPYRTPCLFSCERSSQKSPSFATPRDKDSSELVDYRPSHPSLPPTQSQLHSILFAIRCYPIIHNMQTRPHQWPTLPLAAGRRSSTTPACASRPSSPRSEAKQGCW